MEISTIILQHCLLHNQNVEYIRHDIKLHPRENCFELQLKLMFKHNNFSIMNAQKYFIRRVCDEEIIKKK